MSCNQCGFSHTREMVSVCPHCGMILYNDHNCREEKCPSWNCPKRRDQVCSDNCMGDHSTGYVLLEVKADGTQVRDVFCGAPARFYIENNAEMYWAKMAPILERRVDAKKNKRKAGTAKAAATRARKKAVREAAEARRIERELKEQEEEQAIIEQEHGLKSDGESDGEESAGEPELHPIIDDSESDDDNYSDDLETEGSDKMEFDD
jgi:hypothetical protein